MNETIEQSYDCIVCREEWSTEHFLDDYQDDVLHTDNICIMCHGTIKEAWKNKREYEHETILQVIYYVIKRVFNKTLLAIRLK